VKRVFSEEHRRHISEAKKGIPGLKGSANPMFGRRLTEEERRIHSERMREVLRDPEIRRSLSESHRGKIHSEETKAKMRLSMKGLRRSAEARENIKRAAKKRFSVPENNVMYGKKQSDDAKVKIGANSRKVAVRLWADPEYRNKMSSIHKSRWSDPKLRELAITRMAKAAKRKPNKPETILLDLLNNLYPGQWKYVGDFSLVIDGKCPDFVNCNGQKKIIELFGDYWHRGESPDDRANIFKPFGYETLVIWERELKEPDAVRTKIIEFTEARKRDAR